MTEMSTEMSTDDLDATWQALRNWARGVYTLEAATELLIRAGYADRGPWLQRENDGTAWINYYTIPNQIGAMSGGEQRVMRIAASLAVRDVQIALGDELTGLDQRLGNLVQCAFAHAMGDRDIWSPTAPHK